MQINSQVQQRKRHTTRHIPTILLSAIILCLVLLSACSSNAGNTGSSSSTPVSTPTIDPTSKNQGDMQLLAFQQWISLMQQYNGDTTIYQQQFNADQQALNHARTEVAYKAALAKLNAHVAAIKIPAMKTENLMLDEPALRTTMASAMDSVIRDS